MLDLNLMWQNVLVQIVLLFLFLFKISTKISDIKILKIIQKFNYLMESIKEQVNQLTEKTLEMEDQKLQKEIEEAMDPCNASQPLPEDYLSEEEDSQAKVQSKSEKTKIFIQVKHLFQKDKKLDIWLLE